MSEFYDDTLVFASRKPHVCDGCLNDIPVGSSYQKVAGMFQGDFFHAKMCAECVQHLDECASCQDSVSEYGWTEGELGEMRRECQQERWQDMVTEEF